MKEIKVLGTGCAKCTKTIEVIAKIATELNVDVHVIKETDPEVIMGYGVMSTPAVIIDEVNVHSGSIPHRQEIELWLQQ
ncbi:MULTISPECIES: thioredoxin family protein [Alteromonadales]|jgi:small redox-active disulfide protein 2|uniref:thioredoxin family protein n=1 Tax=Alteromonadales TaxID=135622 RepID=UPI000231922B|nr:MULTISPECIES: thioredoxin family protein [Alteromonadales]KXJ53327.1 MAG: glutaredoxin [Colwellia sp. Phe_37]MBL1386323.1 thioredoxin family protein [Colwellia sp.]TMP50724.1 thioredoxin family protein [Pseudoalteromonas sp. S1688]TMS80793.1 thioredoxin family protein [Pseudoalteromonas sp. S554]TMS92636.1 thioredoxin family protein [Pseudoalteromonas sp. S201]|tara:strand:- start:13555 stop:13791 length:237 start_codon:yes stop_codon:yes gene_type:complete